MTWMKVVAAAGVGVAGLVTLLTRRHPTSPETVLLSAAAPAGDTVPRYSGDSLIRPTGIERWVLAGASMGLGYSQPSGADAARAATGATGGMFHNVYIEPTAYEHYVRTVKFRDKTMFAMTLYEPGQKVHPSKQGFFEGDFLALEVSVKDTERFPGSWAYFNLGKGAPGSKATANPRQACQSCHAQNAADDNVFVQFYPTLRAVSFKFDRKPAADGTGRP